MNTEEEIRAEWNRLEAITVPLKTVMSLLASFRMMSADLLIYTLTGDPIEIMEENGNVSGYEALTLAYLAGFDQAHAPKHLH